MKKSLGIICLLVGFTLTASPSTIEIDMSETIVILDAGHGDVNPETGEYVTEGKRSPEWEDGTQYFEGVGNREIVKEATKQLEASGIKVLHTVDPDGYEDVALSKRVEIANKHYLKHNRKPFLISVHSNGFSKESANGTEVYTSLGTTKSDKIATIWMEQFTKLFPDIKKRTDESDGDVDKEAKFTIITDTLCPAILIETMFHTNREECKILMDSEKRKYIAMAIKNTAIRVESLT